jgi:hypothetical protein
MIGALLTGFLGARTSDMTHVSSWFVFVGGGGGLTSTFYRWMHQGKLRVGVQR